MHDDAEAAATSPASGMLVDTARIVSDRDARGIVHMQDSVEHKRVVELRLRRGRSTLTVRATDGERDAEVMQLHRRMEIFHKGSVVHVRSHEADDEPLLLRFANAGKARAWSHLLENARHERPSPRRRGPGRDRSPPPEQATTTANIPAERTKTADASARVAYDGTLIPGLECGICGGVLNVLLSTAMHESTGDNE